MTNVSPRAGWSIRGWLGLALVAVFWMLNWSLEGLRTHWGFFPLWLGYCLTVDAWTYRRLGTSLWTRSRRHYVGLFLVSAPAWWVFEVINWRTGNWYYEGRAAFGDLEYVALASVSFSTVIPAVFGTAELVGSAKWLRRQPIRPAGFASNALQARFIGSGVLMFALLLLWPRYFFPLVWLSLFLIIDPLNDAMDRRSLLRQAARGDWRQLVALGAGCLVCGFFWEMWNYLSYPKWGYQIPFFDFLRMFEMPLLGYGGYIPFSWELFAFYHLVMGRAAPVPSRSFVQLLPNGACPEG